MVVFGRFIGEKRKNQKKVFTKFWSSFRPGIDFVAIDFQKSSKKSHQKWASRVDLWDRGPGLKGREPDSVRRK